MFPFVRIFHIRTLTHLSIRRRRVSPSVAVHRCVSSHTVTFCLSSCQPTTYYAGSNLLPIEKKKLTSLNVCSLNRCETLENTYDNTKMTPAQIVEIYIYIRIYIWIYSGSWPNAFFSLCAFFAPETDMPGLNIEQYPQNTTLRGSQEIPTLLLGHLIELSIYFY